MSNLLLFQLLQITTNGATEAVAETVGLPQEEVVDKTLSLWELSFKGGWIMIPIAALLVIAVYIFIERFIVIKNAAKENPGFMNEIKDNIQSGNIAAAIKICDQSDRPLMQMLKKGISRIGKPLDDINAAVENVGKLEVFKLEKNLATLATVSGAAPMIGFLGTVMGMIRAFFDMANAGNNIDVSLLSSGIYEAMVTTVAGLVVGILAYFGYNILVAKVDNVVNKLEARTTEFIDLLNEPVN